MKTIARTAVDARKRLEYHYEARHHARPPADTPKTATRVLTFVRTHPRPTRNEIKHGTRLTYGRVCTALDRLLRGGLVRAA